MAVVNPASASPPPSASSRSPSRAPSTHVDYVDTQAFKQLFEGAFETNVLNDYYQVAYHFRLFVVADKDILEQAGNPTTMSDFATKLNSGGIDQATIAESGVTGYNIRDVEIVTVNAQHFLAKEQNATKFVLTIVEPLGTSFLDGLFLGFATLGVFDFTKMHYYLELRFTGYRDDGTHTGLWAIKGNWGNGGYWVWRLKLGLIETKLNEGGATYTITLTPPESELVLDEPRKLAVPQTLKLSGDTLKDLFDAYTKDMNEALKNMFSGTEAGNEGKSLLKVAIVTHTDPDRGVPDIGTFALKTSTPDKSTIKIDHPETGKTQATVAAGTASNDFITSAIKVTERGQELFYKTPSNDPTSPVRTFRETILFSIDPELRVIQTDSYTGNYMKEIIFHVIPFYSQRPILNPDDVKAAQDPSEQRRAIRKQIKLGNIKRRYDYIFTGLNTDIIDFNIDFNMAWQYLQPRLAGARLGYFNEASNAVLNEFQLARIALAAQADLATIEHQLTVANEDLRTSNADYSRILDSIARLRTRRSAIQDRADGSNIPTQSNARQPESRLSGGSSTEVKDAYVEDILDVLAENPTARLKSVPIPISFWQHFQDTTAETGSGLTGPYGRTQSTIGAIMAQVYGTTLTGGFARVNLTIRGDPFWLGQTNIERQMRLRQAPASGTRVVNNFNLPDYVTDKQVVYLHFRYPLQIGEDFTPKLVASESFNGLYEISQVTHTFSDGVFKQKLEGNLLSLHDVNKALEAGGVPPTRPVPLA